MGPLRFDHQTSYYIIALVEGYYVVRLRFTFGESQHMQRVVSPEYSCGTAQVTLLSRLLRIPRYYWFVLFFRDRGNRKYGQASRKLSTGRLNMLPCVHRQPINQMFFLVPLGGLKPLGCLILRGASHLDAFSGYPVRTWLPSIVPLAR